MMIRLQNTSGKCATDRVTLVVTLSLKQMAGKVIYWNLRVMTRLSFSRIHCKWAHERVARGGPSPSSERRTKQRNSRLSAPLLRPPDAGAGEGIVQVHLAGSPEADIWRALCLRETGSQLGLPPDVHLYVSSSAGLWALFSGLTRSRRRREHPGRTGRPDGGQRAKI